MLDINKNIISNRTRNYNRDISIDISDFRNITQDNLISLVSSIDNNKVMVVISLYPYMRIVGIVYLSPIYSVRRTYKLYPLYVDLIILYLLPNKLIRV